jgi:uncharacterized protein (DUF488 family)
MPETITIYTIGHSNHTLDAFDRLLRQHNIALLIDIRSQPYSRWADQFNRERLQRALEAAGFAYRFLGDRLGGRPEDPRLYDADPERPDYKRMEKTTAYQAGIDALLPLAQSQPVALMCSEGDHRRCHRHLLITQTLLKRDVDVEHIQPDGSLIPGTPEAEQLSLFG